MKKILKIIILIVVLSMVRIKEVKAESFYEDNWITGVYVNLIDKDFSKPQLMRFIRRKSDNKASYCITPRVLLYEDETYNEVNSNIINITSDKFKRINEIAYFGYGYANHLSDEWYAITQYMIWKEVEPNMDIFFTDKFKGNRISRFENEINELNNLINNYEKIPNIEDLSLLPNNEYVIEDSSNTLQYYNIETIGNIEIKKVENKLKIKTNDIGNYQIKFIKKFELYNNNPLIYSATKGQNVFLTGKIKPIEKTTNIKVTKGSLMIHKISTDNYEGLSGAVFNIYDRHFTFITTVITDSNGYALVDNLPYDEYTIQEQQAPKGYQIDSSLYGITVNGENIYLGLANDPIEVNLFITKKLDNNEFEKNIEFQIYHDNQLINTIKTNEEGIASTKLKYGTYKIVQLNTTLGYKKIDEFTINIDKNEDIKLELIDKKIHTKLIINKVDENGNKIKEASFKIKNINTDSYLNDKVYKTNNGTLELDIEGGEYLIEEVESPINYIKEESKKIIIDEIYNDKPYILNFVNKRKKETKMKEKTNKEIKEDNPKTNDNILFYIVVGYISFIILLYIIASIKNKIV